MRVDLLLGARDGEADQAGVAVLGDLLRALGTEGDATSVAAPPVAFRLATRSRAACCSLASSANLAEVRFLASTSTDSW